ncbi:MAG: hypothetical protein K6D97_08115 [Clostridia bacterium]|nr:hypothetical protein [Clostridia bacterium]
MTNFDIVNLIIMFVMIAGMWGLTIRHNKRCIALRKKTIFNKSKLECNEAFDKVTGYINIIILVLIFIVAFPQLKFTSTTKLSYMVVFFVLGVLSNWGYYKLGADFDATFDNTIGSFLITLIISIGYAVRFFIIILSFIFTITGECDHTFGRLTDQDETVKYLQPEQIGETQIVHIKDTNEYSFITNEDGIMTLNRMNFNEEDITTDCSETYVMVTISRQNYIDEDRRKDDPEYTYTVETEKYHLFLNKDDMIELSVKE